MNFAYLKEICGLDGKNAVVTGAGNGIGRAAAKALAALGAKVVLVGRRECNIKEAAAEITQAGGSADYRVADQSDKRAIDEFFQWYEQAYRTMDIFVANAGVGLHQTVLESTEKEMRFLIENNYLGAYFNVQNAGRLMKKQGSGSITVVTSINAMSPVHTEALYSSLKAGLENMVRSAAVELSEYGVRVNTMAPGATLTGMSDLLEHPDQYRQFNAAIPLKHVGMPEEIGEAIALMNTPAFRYMTGCTITIDGGLLLRQKLF